MGENAVVLDSTDTFGTIPPGVRRSGSSGFVFVCLDTIDNAFEVEMVNTGGNSWTDRFELVRPSPPVEVSALSGMGCVHVTWKPPDDEDAYAYLVHRSTDGGDSYTPVNRWPVIGVGVISDSSVTPGQEYTYVVTVIDTSGNESDYSDPVYPCAGPAQMPGWPVALRHVCWSSPVAADLDGDDDLEVLVGCKDGSVYAWHHDGQPVDGWPCETTNEIWSSPSVGNLDDDKEMEVVVGSYDGNMYAWNHDGSGLLSSDGVFTSIGSMVRCTPTLSDLDEDGTLEIVHGAGDGFVYAWMRDGTGFRSPDGVFGVTGAEVASTPAIADIDQDGHLEVFAGSMDGVVYAWRWMGLGYLNPDGTFAWAPGAWASPAIGNLDVSGHSELVIASTGSETVHAFSRWGASLDGFPRDLGDEVWSSPAIGDIDGDGDLEIVVGSNDNKTFALHHTAEGVPDSSGVVVERLADFQSSPILVDMDGDHVLDIITCSVDRSINVVKWDGTPIPGWPFLVDDDIYSTPCVADLDLDGDLELIVATYGGRVYNFDLQVSVDDQPDEWWPMFHHDPFHTGWLDFEDLTDVEDGWVVGPPGGLPAVSGLVGAVPNPFNPVTTLQYQIAPVDPDTPASARPVKLSIYNVQGQLVRQLVHGSQRPGFYRIVWDGESVSGRSVASGVYFCRLRIDSTSFTQKIVVAR